jgi:hypothetical protein
MIDVFMEKTVLAKRALSAANIINSSLIIVRMEGSKRIS